ncbi:MAG: helicase-exonuclease AddAB subunit AddA [Clostridium sp.]|nr:helicase-exonuclease AddAB subunit AddA [Clostridium sp.]MCM1399285.1 helicase-exonuclease AddAB subunit AddA [Clostridium sp.]MCM1459773.1 helicase-exonuclease AddAB subunit AddA [Bacteroides sp.]
MAWTNEQKSAIDLRDKTILVSAAAGSGKTAVLVERICSRILDETKPLDIDRFLVVTFTKAAAAQMRDKISARLWSELEKRPDNRHLTKQLALINRADITTIDSFCLRIVREYFSLLDIDSDFGIGDRGMIELLKADVMDALFEEKYNGKQEECSAFLRLVDLFGGDKDDGGLREQILKIYNMAGSYPDPMEWLRLAEHAYEAGTPEDFEGLLWVKELVKLSEKTAGEAWELVCLAEALTDEAGGPYKNKEAAGKDKEIIKRLCEAHTYGDIHEVISSVAWQRLKPCKGDEFDERLVTKFKELREGYKSRIKTLDIFKVSRQEAMDELAETGIYLSDLLCLVREFSIRFMEEKKKRHTMEFSDIEHFAYQLCCGGYEETWENGVHVKRAVPTEIGRSIMERYDEIYIDEYQDSNFLQEDILMSVSGMCDGKYNVFLVGDVKQSIYKFRMARPDLFVGKYDRFPVYSRNDNVPEVKIELKNNFRSRAVVLNAVNYFFYQLMGQDLGGIEYNDDVALVPSKEYPMPMETVNVSSCAELMVVDMGAGAEAGKKKNMGSEKNAETGKKGFPAEEADEEKIEADKIKLEAAMIGERIKTLVGGVSPMYVFDEEGGEYRKACYRDIVILVRSISSYGDALYNTLSAMNIPVYVEDPQGYFEATEIRILMSLLSVVDNSRQDIPLAAVLMSPIGGLCENELAVICEYGDETLKSTTLLYDKCICYMEDKTDDISRKLGVFFDKLKELKQDKISMSISELLLKALDITGYYYYALAMPMGERRRANINMLIEKARTFEDGNFKGLFNFLRYVEKLKINEVDFGEANTIGDDEDVVRVMTMHKSKGLEFPIVFVSGLGKQFNMQDMRDNIIIHADYYLASKRMYRDKRYRKKTVMRDAVSLIMKQETLAEEMRILYVAMTRAKEKLILTGTVASYEDVKRKADTAKQVLLPYGVRAGERTFLGWIFACMERYDQLANDGKYGAEINTVIVKPSELAGKEINEQAKQAVNLDMVIKDALDSPKDALYREYRESFAYVYPYERLTEIKSKMSISEIKKMKAYDGASYDVSEEYKETVFADDTALETTVDGENQNRLTGAERGTLVHKFMELLDFAALEPDSDYKDMIAKSKAGLVAEGIFTDIEAKAVNIRKINDMLQSSLGQRMILAAKAGNLQKEQQFSIGIPVSEIYGESGDDVIIVQGIIDAFFYEGDDIILMDYKTDAASADVLISRYHAQLKYYGETLERLTGCTVKEKLIYSFYLNEIIPIE